MGTSNGNGYGYDHSQGPVRNGDDFDYADSDDYYAYFNVPPTASIDEITNAYRRLSRTYHPDKHTDQMKKKDAESQFTKMTKAYEVLTDPHQRMIYDLYGIKGLKTEGWELVERRKSPIEIAEEYRRLREVEERKRLELATNPKTSVNVTFNATEIFENSSGEDLVARVFSTELKSLRIGQQVDMPITEFDTVTLGGTVLSTGNGIGIGTLMTSYRKILNEKTWAECEVGFGSAHHNCAAKIVRTLSPTMVLTSSINAQVKGNTLIPGMQNLLTVQLAKHLQGRLLWSVGLQSFIQASAGFENDRHFFNAGVLVGWRASHVEATYVRKFQMDNNRFKTTVRYGTSGASLELGAETQVSKYSRLGSSLIISVPSGVAVKIKLLRNNQVYVFQVLMSEEVIPSSIFYGSVLPILSWFAIRALVIKPWQQQQASKELAKKQEEHKQRMVEKKAAANAAISLMQETVRRIREAESANFGLVITRALYGHLPEDAPWESLATLEIPLTGDPGLIDVTVPLQAQVKDSKLIVPGDVHKSNLEGFYDPCYGEVKKLYIRYLFHGSPHETCFGDREAVMLPQQRHKIMA